MVVSYAGITPIRYEGIISASACQKDSLSTPSPALCRLGAKI